MDRPVLVLGLASYLSIGIGALILYWIGAPIEAILIVSLMIASVELISLCLIIFVAMFAVIFGKEAI